jgi:2-polyprenyl-3-methyl-5-hydroxy-6-metoxy-1,4-benzoquinol methylase
MKKPSYSDRVANEIKHYKQIFKNGLFQEVPPIWNEVERKFSDYIEQATGVRGLSEYVARATKGRKTLKVLSLGSGACGVELLALAPRLAEQGCTIELTSADINGDVIAQAQEEAQKRGVAFVGLTQDINKLKLKPNTYDVIMAYAALHHFENISHVAKEINKALKPKGMFVTVDIPSRNGYLLWDETKVILDKLWKIMPAKYKWDHTVTKIPIYMASFPNVDYSINSFECSNSEAIIPALRKHMRETVFVPAFAMVRRFFDTKFGPNYDLRRDWDRNFFAFVTEMDHALVTSGKLQPETFFGVYSKKK